MRASCSPCVGTVAVAHTLLVIVCHLVAAPEAIYQHLGVRYFDERDRHATIRRSVTRRVDSFSKQYQTLTATRG
jgi:hypothetical protein